MSDDAASTITVLVADDQPAQRAGFRMVLDSQADITVVADCGDGAQALAHARRQRIDVILMDVRMPRVNGLVAAQRITGDAKVLGLGPAPRIVFVTALDLEDHIAAAVDAGAHAMLYKDVPPETLLDAIRSAALDGQD